MSEKRHGNRKKFKKVKPEMDSLIESDEYFGFIAGNSPKQIHQIVLKTIPQRNSKYTQSRTKNNNQFIIAKY
ncbi:MAG: hypothetical protein GQ564_23485 [Bacteroidales bacterium]|nr:hypothetical protein [Bacteroidales bacterium]